MANLVQRVKNRAGLQGGRISAMTRREFCGSVAILSSPRASTSRSPNVLFILADQWRAQATGYAGDPNAHTPTLDRLAAASANFVNAVSGCPVCSPYRGSLMTGQYPLTHGVFINDVELKPKGPTLGQAFQNAGYRTGYIGKWHLYGSPDGQYGRRQAFIPREKQFGFEYWKAFECSHNYNKSGYYEGGSPALHYWEGYDAIAQTADACAFIERYAPSSEPFFLMLSFGPPHNPYGTAPEAYRQLYEKREIQLRPNVPKDRRSRAIEDLRGYYAHIAALDDCVKRLLETLDKMRIAENTIVVFTSDHGDMLGSQGLQFKQHPWDESVRVPFLIRYPRRLGAKGRSIRQPLNAPDIMPTLLSLAGIPIPESVQGADLSAYAGGEKPEDPEAGALLNLPAAFTQARACGFAEYRGLRTACYTYVRSIDGPWLLYDNQADPYQMRNLLGRPETRALQAKLDQALQATLRRLHDDFLPGETYLRRAGLLHYREVQTPVRGCSSPWKDWGPTMKGPFEK